MNLIETLKKHSIIPVASIETLDAAYQYLEELRNKQIRIVEFTLRSQNALHILREIVKDTSFSEFTIGVGTITSVEQMSICHKIGVKFQVSPGFIPDLLNYAKENNISYLPGAITPHEIMTLQSFGIYCAKFFPAVPMNGLEVLKSYASVFPKMKFCATGGINKHNKSDYLSLDNVIAIGSSSI
ncbi:bifunctional 4-hydroxy-2-oxoglutarate aldolase/2-dehydro-3-deoxy-phosphogluconate aldolase [Cysteiniphilum halobium]|uniref:bifunctional 4-hydroxy-2-oxoglutarate aldolase/2-dehydro-3-deoxy-phosphogluconate aldolase n=1 Tax=Cysteiniphilum halobium TaxID=2219059 RepID=UPI003F874630